MSSTRSLQFVGEPPVAMAWNSRDEASVSRVVEPDGFPRVSSLTDESVYSLLQRASSDHSALGDLSFETAVGAIRHPPFELDAQMLRPDDEVELVVQHRKHSPLFGTIFYTERLSAGGVVDRSLGITTGADVVVENSIVRSLFALGSPGPIDVGFGAARIRARTQAAMVTLAGIYSEAVLPQLSVHAPALVGLAVILSDLSLPGVWDQLASTLRSVTGA